MEGHNIIRVDGTTLECACGRILTGPTLEQARRAHQGHWGVEGAREVLRKADHG